MDLKRIGKALLFPHILIMLVLVPLSTVLLVFSIVFIGTESPIAYVSYVLSAYTLTVWCFKIPYLIKSFKKFKEKNRFYLRWKNDIRLKVKVSLYGSLVWNTAYGSFLLWLGFYHRTFWFYSLAAYYISLAFMRFFLVRYTRRYTAGEKLYEEFKGYRNCGFVFLIMNLALSLIIFFMVYWNRTFVHHEITTIAMAAYTFTSFTMAIINLIKYRKYKSPVYSASKMISFASACVSMLTLESTMLTTWGQESGDMFRRIMLAATGTAISAFIIVISVYMIISGNKGMKKIQNGSNKIGEKNGK